ncbi:MAG: hypothetical protein ABI378_13435 [Chitinophagaceae bacterium]
METLDLLQARLSDLIKSYKALQQDLKKQEKLVAKFEKENLDLNRKIAAAEAQLLAHEVNAAIPDKEMKAKTRQKLDSIIAEIDQILIGIHE